MISVKVSALNPPFPLDDADSRVAISDRSSATPCMSRYVTWNSLLYSSKDEMKLVVTVNKLR